MSKLGVLAILNRAACEPQFIGQLTDDFPRAVKSYHLSKGEHAALASGDIRWIEEHCGKLDERLRTWLYCRLGQEIWGLPAPAEQEAELEEAQREYVDGLLRMLAHTKTGAT